MNNKLKKNDCVKIFRPKDSAINTKFVLKSDTKLVGKNVYKGCENAWFCDLKRWLICY